MTRRTTAVASVLGTCLLASLPQAGSAQTEPMSHREVYVLDTGFHSGSGDEAIPVHRDVVRVTGARWLRLHFGNCDLGAESYLTITSLADQATQRLDAGSLSNYYGSSAFFRGDAVELVLYAAPGEMGIHVRVEAATVGDPPGPWGPRTLCDGDDRTPDLDVAVGRIRSGQYGSVAGTGWIISNGAQLTAGHVPLSNGILEFFVPLSNDTGSWNPAHPDYQFSIDQSSVVSAVDGAGTGSDWAIFACHPNSNTGLLPHQVGGFHRMTRDESPASVRVTGYGFDDTPFEFNNYQQSDQGPLLREVIEGTSDVYLEYLVDTRNGNSGGPVISLDTGMTMGIHTDGGCDPPLDGNRGTGFENDALEAAIQTFPGLDVIYVDRGHAATVEDGSVFRPFHTVVDASAAIIGGEIVSIVEGIYAGPVTFDQPGTLAAPVGPVWIGQSPR